MYPEDDPELAGELSRLRISLPTEVALLVGGRATLAYLDHLEKIGAIIMENLTHLGLTLDTLRKPAKKVTR